MKNLSKFQAQELKMSEMRETKGGYGWNDSYDRPFGRPDYGGGYGSSKTSYSTSITQQQRGSQADCPACQRFHHMNNPVSGHNHQPTTTPLGQFIFNTLPHWFGWGNHK